MSCRIIGIAGGSASGKTTVAEKIYELVRDHGSVVLIRMDDYYNLPDKIMKNADNSKNFDHPLSYDTDLLISHLNSLKEHLSIEKPLYDFVTSSRFDQTEKISPADVVIVEGIMTFVDERLRKCFDIKIFVDTETDVRFIRRLNRDIKERKRSIDSIINQYLSTVRPMHNAFVEPSKKFADIIIPEGGHNSVAIDLIANKIITILNFHNKEKMNQ